MRRLWLVPLPFAVVIIVIVIKFSTTAVEPEDVDHVVIDIPQGHLYGGGIWGRHLDISPDGKKIVYVGRRRNQNRRLYLQTIGEPVPTEIAGTDLPNDPSFSPDGRYVAFYSGETVKKAAVDGTGVSIIGSAAPPRGIEWMDNDTLILGNTQGLLLQMRASEGEPSPLRVSMGPHLPHLSPSILPGGKAIVFTFANGPMLRARIGVLFLDTGEERQLLEDNAFAPRYAASGHLVFATGFGRSLMAVRFDLDTLQIAGIPQLVLGGPLSGRGTGGSTDYAISAAGPLIYTHPRDPSIEDVLAHLADSDSSQIHVQLDWLDRLRTLIP